MLFNSNNRSVFIFLSMLLYVSSLRAGTDFVAVSIPQSLYQTFTEIQQYVARNLQSSFTLDPSSSDNLHITLKEIGDLTVQEREAVKEALKEVAIHFSSHNIGHILAAGHLEIKPDGLVILRIRSRWLTALAYDIDNALRKLKEQRKISTLLDRMDFPDHAHIPWVTLNIEIVPLMSVKHQRL